MGNLVETQKKLIDEAIRLFASKGYRGTTIRDIARATGMTVSNTYYHFGSKQGLMLAVIDRLSTELQTEMEDVFQKYSDPLKRFKELVRTHLDRVVRDRHSASLFFLQEEDLIPDNNLMKEVQTSFLSIYQRALADLRTAGYLRSKNVTILAFHIVALVQWHFHWYKPEGKLPLEDVKKETLEFILKGILKSDAKDRVKNRRH